MSEVLSEIAYCSRCQSFGYLDDARPMLLILDGLCHACWTADAKAEPVESLLP